ncbi:phytoene desaturase family protein [Nesterenkonia sandarakina]|uniref:Phytoene desaturase n=1 Tax=Nesterenkonia sandarakina TaxID=272918 RepID=A0A7Z0J2Y6_9MICC|nr:phytoene desaturase family protein [Nesterenkonia sandarakina]NYJ16747.1 phytoene desaturase [Nesterenkonia sandarakina]
MPRTIVIGAGVAGLASAALLAREGHDVLVLEKGERTGGRAGMLAEDGFRFDTGPSWYLMPSVFEHFYNLMGTTAAEQLTLVDLDPAYRVYSEPEPGQAPPAPVDLPKGAERVRALFEELEPGSGPALEKYIASAKRTTAIAERRFLYNPFKRLNNLAVPEVLKSAPELAQLLLTSLERFVQRRFKHPVLRQILGYPAVFLGTRPQDAPAMYHLMSALDLDDGVRYPMGGFWEVLASFRRLAEGAGAQITTGAEVIEILTEASPRTGFGSRLKTGGQRVATGVRWRDEHGTVHTEHADHVVSAADLHHTETALLAEADRSYPESWWDKVTSGPGAVLVMLGVRGKLPELAHHSLFFTQDWTANFESIFGENPSIPTPASSYVCRASASEPGLAPEDHENLFVLIPVPADLSLGAGGRDGAGDPAVEQIAQAAIEQIGGWAGIEDFEERIVLRETIGPADFAADYNSWRGSVLGQAHTLLQSAMFRPQNVSPKVRGLYYAGGTVAPGIGVPMCLISAELVLKHLRRDYSAGPLRPDSLGADTLETRAGGKAG